MKDISLLTIANRKEESRKIVKQILDFGITESQKVDIIFNIAMTLEENSAMQEIGNIVKKYRTEINKNEEIDNISISKKKVILT